MRAEFGTLDDGRRVERLRIAAGEAVAHVLTYGAILQDFRLRPGGAPLIVGFETLAPYATRGCYFGPIVGRYANRIRDGALDLGGRTWLLDRNEGGRHCLHGGAGGVSARLWDVVAHAADRVTLGLVLDDGEMGFPGRLHLSATYRMLAGGVLDLVIEARAEAPTVCNLASHVYWSLGAADVRGLDLRIAAEGFLETRPDLIPTGRVLPVAGDIYDFRQFRRIGPVSAARPMDVNFCLSPARTDIRPIAWLRNPDNGLMLELRSTEPGLQVFDGAPLGEGGPGLDGQPTGAYCGLALEPQVWPDAPHHPQFPQAWLNPGETYLQHTQFALSQDGAPTEDHDQRGDQT